MTPEHQQHLQSEFNSCVIDRFGLRMQVVFLEKEVEALTLKLQSLTETNETLRKQLKGADDYVFPKL